MKIFGFGVCRGFALCPFRSIWFSVFGKNTSDISGLRIGFRIFLFELFVRPF